MNRSEFSENEEGSIIPLIALYFSIAMLMIFVAANIASTYIARRDLINLTEAALSKATQELDEFVYYYQPPVFDYLTGRDRLVPLNCSDAGTTFSRELVTLSFSNNGALPRIVDFNCDGRTLFAQVEQQHFLPFAVKVLNLYSFTNQVSVEAVSRYLETDS